MHLMIRVNDDRECQKMYKEEWGVTGFVRDDGSGDQMEHGVMVFFDHGAAQVYLSDIEARSVAELMLSATEQK